MNCYLQTFQKDDIMTIWQEVEPLFDTICRNSEGRYATQHILQSLITEQAQLWTARDEATHKFIMVCTTEIRIYPTGAKWLVVSDIAGKDYKRWLWIFDKIKDWSKELGCVGIESQGRIGWKKIMKNFKKHSIIYSELYG